MPTLRQLEYLVAIANHRHFGRAAQAAFATQPTLSHQLKALEERLGVALVDRRQNSAELTPIGRDIAERARTLLVGVRDIRDVARRARDGAAGTIRFGVTPTLGPYLIPAIVADLHREQPDLRLYIREGIPDEQIRQLSRGALDMLLGPQPIDDEALHVEPLFRERLFLAAPADHPLAARPRVRRADLAGERVLSLFPQHHLHRQVAAICEELGMRLLRDYEGSSLDSLRQMVGSGIGLAVLPALYTRSEVGGHAGVRVLEVDGWKPFRSIAAAWRRGAAYSPVYADIAERVRTTAMSLHSVHGNV